MPGAGGRRRGSGARADRGTAGAGDPGRAQAVPNRTVALVLALCAFLVYNVNGREAYPTGDSRPTGLLPFSMLYEGDLDLNEYHPPDAAVGGPIRSESGRIVSNYSPLPALLSLPLYLPAWPHRGEINGDIFRWEPFFAKLAGSFWASAAVACFFLAAAQVASQRAALLAALALAFASPFWISASQTLGQHGLTALLASLALLCLARRERSGGASWALAAGACCALAVGIRLSNIVIFGSALVYLAIRHPRDAAVFAAPVLVAGIPAALYLLAIVGGSSGGLEAFAFLPRVTAHLRGEPLEALPALLVSPGEGLFTWSPVLLLLLLPAGTGVARSAGGSRSLLLFCLCTAALLLVLYSSYVSWWGGRTYGPRYLTDLLPFLLLPAAAGLGPWIGRRTFWALFVALFLWSAYVQALGAFRYPCRGSDVPSRVRLDEERIWSWRDSDIVLCAESQRRPGQDLRSAGRLISLTFDALVP